MIISSSRAKWRDHRSIGDDDDACAATSLILEAVRNELKLVLTELKKK